MKFSRLTMAAMLGVAIMASSFAPTPAEAKGKTGALVGGLVAGAVIGGAIASTAKPYPYYKRPRVYYGPACGYYPYPPCGPVYVAPPPPPPYYYPPRY